MRINTIPMCGTEPLPDPKTTGMEAGATGRPETPSDEDAENFVDPCHFTPEVQAEFLALLVDTLREIRGNRPE